MGLLPIKKFFLQNENLNKFDTSFTSSWCLIHLVNIAWFAPVLACFVLFTSSVPLSLLLNPAGSTPQVQQWNAEKRGGIFSKLTVKAPKRCQCFLMSLCHCGCSGVFFKFFLFTHLALKFFYWLSTSKCSLDIYWFFALVQIFC